MTTEKMSLPPREIQNRIIYRLQPEGSHLRQPRYLELFDEGQVRSDIQVFHDFKVENRIRMDALKDLPPVQLGEKIREAVDNEQDPHIKAELEAILEKPYALEQATSLAYWLTKKSFLSIYSPHYFAYLDALARYEQYKANFLAAAS